MALRRKKGYKFSDEVMAKDAIISLLFGILALLCIVFSIVLSIVMKGNIPDFIGGVLMIAVIMSVTAFIFGLFSYADSEGGMMSKRASVLVSLIDIAALVILYFI